MRGYKWKFKVKRSRLQLRRCFQSESHQRVEQATVVYVMEAASVNSFKKRLDDWSMDNNKQAAYIHHYYKLEVTSYIFTYSFTHYRNRKSDIEASLVIIRLVFILFGAVLPV